MVKCCIHKLLHGLGRLNLEDNLEQLGCLWMNVIDSCIKKVWCSEAGSQISNIASGKHKESNQNILLIVETLLKDDSLTLMKK